MTAWSRSGDFWAGLVLAGLGVYIVSEAWGWTYLGEDGPGPGFFPRWYGGAMVVLSLLLVIGTVLRPGAAKGEKKALQSSELRRALTCWLALAVCVALLKPLGFVIAFALLAWFMIAVMFGRPKLEALAFAIGGSLGFYALFAWALNLPLPVGSLFA